MALNRFDLQDMLSDNRKIIEKITVKTISRELESKWLLLETLGRCRPGQETTNVAIAVFEM